MTSHAPRRRFLAAAGLAAVVGVAGCIQAPREHTPTPVETEAPPAAPHDVLLEPAALPDEPSYETDILDLMTVIERENESIAIVDTTRHERIARVNDVGKAIHVVDYPRSLPEGTREGAFVYTQSREGWMYKIDLWGFQRVSRVRAGVDARDIALSRDSEYVAGGCYDPKQLFVAYAEDMAPRKIIGTSGQAPSGETLPSQVHALYDVPVEGLFLMALHEAGRVQLVDYTRPTLPIVADIPVAAGLHDGFFGPDGRYFFIASQDEALMGVIDTRRRRLAATIDTAAVPHPGPGALDPERNLAFTTHLGAPKVTVWNTKTFEIEASIDVPGKGLFIQNHPGSPYVWADVIFDSDETDSLVYAIDPETLSVAMTVDTSQWGPGRSLHPEFTRDGSAVYFSLWDAGTLVVLDSRTGELVAQLDGFTTPTGKFLATRAEEHAYSTALDR